jgi:hypothetical protein
LGHLLAARITPAIEQKHAQVQQLARQIPQDMGQTVKLAIVDQDYTGKGAAQVAHSEGIELQVINCPRRRKLRVAYSALGGRTQLRLGYLLSEARTRL